MVRANHNDDCHSNRIATVGRALRFVANRPGHDFRYSLNWERIQRLSWRPKAGIEEGLQKTID